MEEARRSNMRHRPVGLGVQGLADAFLMMILGDKWCDGREICGNMVFGLGRWGDVVANGKTCIIIIIMYPDG